MLKATIYDLAMFENLLGVINKFVQQCQFVLTTKKVDIYCKNPTNFASARLLLDSNVIQLNEGQGVEIVEICIRDVIAFKSAISIIQQIDPDTTEIEINLDDDSDEGGKIKSISYKSKNGGSFNLITIDFDVIKDFVSKEVKTELSEDWKFNINPKNLDIIQNRTNNIVNMDEISVYIYAEDGKAVFELTSKKSSAINSIALPVANSYEGSLEKCAFKEIAIHESSFRIFNILRVTREKDIECIFDISHNIFRVTSHIENNDCYINSRLFIQMVKGK